MPSQIISLKNLNAEPARWQETKIEAHQAAGKILGTEILYFVREESIGLSREVPKRILARAQGRVRLR